MPCVTSYSDPQNMFEAACVVQTHNSTSEALRAEQQPCFRKAYMLLQYFQIAELERETYPATPARTPLPAQAEQAVQTTKNQQVAP